MSQHPAHLDRPTGAWVNFSYISFAASVLMVGGGIFALPLDWWVRAYFAMGTGMVVGGALKVLGASIGTGGKAVASGVGDVVKDGTKRSGDQIQSFIQEAVQSVSTNAAPQATTRASREIGFAVTKLFAPGGDVNSPANRAAVIKALMDYTQVSEAAATKTVDDWTTSYNNLKTELDNLKTTAEQKARVAADQAASNLSSAAIWSFSGLLIGLLVSAGGGVLGGDHAIRRIKVARTTETLVR